MTTGSRQTGKISLLLSILLISLSTTSTSVMREPRQFICWVEFEILFHQDKNDSLHSSRILAPACADGCSVKQPAVSVKIKASNVIFSCHLLLVFLLCFFYIICVLNIDKINATAMSSTWSKSVATGQIYSVKELNADCYKL